jgi:hypothetical protein
MKYRLRMNGNGKYLVQRREGWGLPWETWSGDGWEDDFVDSGTVFNTNEEACKGLVAAQEFDDYLKRDVRWTTVYEEEAP